MPRNRGYYRIILANTSDALVGLGDARDAEEGKIGSTGQALSLRAQGLLRAGFIAPPAIKVRSAPRILQHWHSGARERGRARMRGYL